MHIPRPVLPLLLAAVLLPAPAGADAGAQTAAEAVFTALERQLIRDYYREAHAGERDGGGGERGEHEGGKGGRGAKGGGKGGLPPGLARKEALPPGLERQLERNGRLPPGLEKRRLPAELDRRLPRRRAGLERVVVDTDVLLIETATGIIRDILRDVVR